MMRKSLALCAILIGLATAPAIADTFHNGGFENGDLSGWTQGGGYWAGEWPINPTQYLPGGSLNNSSYMVNTVVTPGIDPISGLNKVYNGNYAVQVNDSNNNNSISVISQTVSNYTDTNIYFAWQAVLQGSHDLTDSDNFTLKLTNVTKGIDLYNVSYSSASAAGTSLFNYNSGLDWYYTNWQVQNLDVSQYVGDTFTLTLLGSDCPYGGHAGYVYLDGFGGAPPIEDPGGSPVPEPSTFALLGSGVAALAARFRRKLMGAEA
ncbi:MAG TPA: PEP-CTERM sorting domain-containing protein [Edaphobacter sp.]|nr:PEP-CTERM sorting domain-containing protein [Edaphobacter sp.]